MKRATFSRGIFHRRTTGVARGEVEPWLFGTRRLRRINTSDLTLSYQTISMQQSKTGQSAQDPTRTLTEESQQFPSVCRARSSENQGLGNKGERRREL